jgi:hypothetical protein
MDHYANTDMASEEQLLTLNKLLDKLRSQL